MMRLRELSAISATASWRRSIVLLLVVWLIGIGISGAAAQEAIPAPVQRLAQAVDQFAALATGTDPYGGLLRLAAEHLEGRTGTDLVVAGLGLSNADVAFGMMRSELSAVEAAVDDIERGEVSWTPEAVAVYLRAQEKFRSVPPDLFRRVLGGLEAAAVRPPGPVTGTAFQDEARRIREQGLKVLGYWRDLLSRKWPEPPTLDRGPNREEKVFDLKLGFQVVGILALSLSLVLLAFRRVRWAGWALAAGALLSLPGWADLLLYVVRYQGWFTGTILVLVTALSLAGWAAAAWWPGLPKLPRRALMALAGRAAALTETVRMWLEREQETRRKGAR